MKSICELPGLITRERRREIQAEIEERHSKLDELELLSLESEGNGVGQSAVVERRLNLENEISRLTMELSLSDSIHPPQLGRKEIGPVLRELSYSYISDTTPVLQKAYFDGYRDGRAFERRRRQIEGGRRRNEKLYSKHKQFAIKKAAEIWEGSPETRIGKVVDAIFTRLEEIEAPYRPGKATIKKWLKAAKKSGELTIPEAASRPGAPKR